MSRWSRDSQVGRSLGAARPNPVRSEVADYESVNHSRKEDPLFGRSPPPGIDSNGPNPELRGSSRGNEPDYLRLQRVATEDAEDEDNYFYSRYESIKGIGWRRFRVEERRTVGEVLSDANKDGYQYALVTYGNQTYLLCRKRIIYGLDDLDLSTRQEGRIFALRDYYDDGQRFGNHATNERTGARLAIEVRAWFNQKEPIFRGRQFLPADYKLHNFDLEQPDHDTVARLNDVDLDTVKFEDLEAEWTGRPRDNAGGRDIDTRGPRRNDHGRSALLGSTDADTETVASFDDADEILGHRVEPPSSSGDEGHSAYGEPIHSGQASGRGRGRGHGSRASAGGSSRLAAQNLGQMSGANSERIYGCY